jgi:hypothetical protein
MHGLDATGVAPRFWAKIRIDSLHAKPATGTPPGDLAVSDFGTGAVEVLNSSYAVEQTITSGLNGPDGDWYDAKEHLYVANYAGINVTEYNHDSTAVAFTYSSGLSDPVNVRTGAGGNVYVADYNSGSAGSVFEYAQHSNTVLTSCNTGLANEGIAIDGAGDVFVDGNNPNTGTGNIVEYKGGLSGCHGTTLTPTLAFAGGMTIDKNGTLIVNDQLGPTVDLIKSPYGSISGTCGSGYADPFHVGLNHKQNLLFVADVSNANVQVLNYPACSLNTTLGSGNGLSDPAGVAAPPGRRQ